MGVQNMRSNQLDTGIDPVVQLGTLAKSALALMARDDLGSEGVKKVYVRSIGHLLNRYAEQDFLECSPSGIHSASEVDGYLVEVDYSESSSNFIELLREIHHRSAPEAGAREFASLLTESLYFRLVNPPDVENSLDIDPEETLRLIVNQFTNRPSDSSETVSGDRT